jgi:hypothetical protein
MQPRSSVSSLFPWSTLSRSLHGGVGADLRPNWKERSEHESLTGKQWRRQAVAPNSQAAETRLKRAAKDEESACGDQDEADAIVPSDPLFQVDNGNDGENR